MGMKPRQPQNWNDQLRENDASLKGWAAMFGKETPAHLLNNVAPKRQRAPSLVPSEHSEQVTVIHFWRHACHTYKLPEFALFAVPNGVYLGDDPKMRAIQMGRLKAEGLRTGIPDLVLAARTPVYAGLYVEMKRIDGYASPEQKDVGAYLLGAGYQWKVCRGADAAIAEIKAYLG